MGNGVREAHWVPLDTDRMHKRRRILRPLPRHAYEGTRRHAIVQTPKGHIAFRGDAGVSDVMYNSKNEAITTGTLYFAMMMFHVCRLASLSFVRKRGESLLMGTFLLLTGFAPLAFNRTDTSFTQRTLHHIQGGGRMDRIVFGRPEEQTCCDAKATTRIVESR